MERGNLMKMSLKELGIENDMPKGWVKGKGQPRWHRLVYDKWVNMHDRVKNPSNPSYPNYKDSKICESLDYLSNYVKFIESQPTFDEFCSTCDKIVWSVDKDIKVKDNKDYYPEFMSLVTRSENSKDRNNRYDYSVFNKAIKGTSLKDGSILIFESRNSVREKGFDPGCVTKCCTGERKSHKGYKWEYLDKE